MSPARHADVAVVGGGIVGLAHALHAARDGRSVVVFERHARAIGASVRNFGMVLVSGQPDERVALARRSREIWLELAEPAGLFARRTGSVLPLRSAAELRVARDFAGNGLAGDRDVRLLDRAATLRRTPWLRADGLEGALWSDEEATVDPREALVRLPAYLAERYGVQLRYGVPVGGVGDGEVQAGDERWSADRVVVCTGEDVDALVPGVLASSGTVRCTLQMLRSAPLQLAPEPDAAPALLSALTLLHYPAFAAVPSLGALRTELDERWPVLTAGAVNVMATQHGTGELTIGDTHVYGDTAEPFARVDLDDGVLAYLRELVDLPELRITQRWTGCYLVSQREPVVVRDVAERLRVVLVAASIGMSVSFGVAEQTLPAA